MARQQPNQPPKPPEIPPIAPDIQIRSIVAAIDQLSRLTRPKFYGIERVTGERTMIVGNHTIYGVFDVPFMVAELYKRNGLTLRSLGDHRHWKVPGWGRFLEGVGAVRGTREITAELMRRGEPILVFPGGAREVNKRRGEKYQLIWKNRLGFAKLAIEHGYAIQPLASVGGEEVLDVLLDDSNPIHGRISSVCKQTLGVPLPSIVRGIGPTMIPRPQRFYFWFGEPIESGKYKGKGEAGARRLRDAVKSEIECGIEFLQGERARDPGRKFLTRVLGRDGD